VQGTCEYIVLRYNTGMRRGLTQQQLALLSGITQPTIALYMTGQRIPKDNNLRRLSEALEMTEEECMVMIMRRKRQRERELDESLKQSEVEVF
jgi:transcriptional regulator with XRE-family HTH domain